MSYTSDHEIEISRELRENQTPWTWVQPANTNELLERLARARDLDVPARERENLCSCAFTEIMRLLALQQRAPTDSETVCGECDGSGWRERCV